MKATIITIGDEILLGQILDTNSRLAAAELARIGIETVHMESIADHPPFIAASVTRALQLADFVLITGGLGPTNDDVTKKTLADYFHTPLVFYPQVYEWLQEYFSHYPNKQLSEYNKTQAFLPKDCTILRNRKGTASGMWFERNGKVVVSIPGVPTEAEYLLQAEILPRLKDRLGPDVIRYQMLTVIGTTESQLAVLLQSFEKNLPPFMRLAYLPSAGFVRLRLTAKGPQADQALALFWPQLQQALRGFSVLFGEEPPEQELVKQLAACGQSIAVAESCSGGYIAHLITSVAGASAYFKGAVVAYSNEAKQQILGVQTQDLLQYGAVSEIVAKQMAQGARRCTGAQWAVATTGIAGPDGGSVQKPVGTVWIAIAGPNFLQAKEFHFAATRERNISKTAITALEWLIACIKQSR